MASLFQGIENPATAPQSHRPAPEIAFPAPTSQPNSNRIFFVPDYIIGGSSRRVRHSVSVPQLSKPQTGSTNLHKSPLSTSTNHASEIIDAEHAAASSSKGQSSSQFGKFKIKLPYNLARQRLNKFINKTLIPSFFYGSESPSSSSASDKSSENCDSNSSSHVDNIRNQNFLSDVTAEPFPTNAVQQGPIDAPHCFFEDNTTSSDQQHLRHEVLPSQSTPNLNIYSPAPPFLSFPAETASISSLRASRSRQGSVSTILTNNENNLSTTNLSITDGYLGIPGQNVNDASSLYGLPVLARQQSVTSSASASSSYYPQQYQFHHQMQHQLLPKRSFLSDSESMFFSSKESSTSASKSNQKSDLVRYLPREIVDQIFTILDIKSLNACILVNKNWQFVANANAVWRAKYFQKLYWDTTSGHLPEESMQKGKRLPSLTWKNIYKTRTKLEERWRKGKVEPKALKGHTDSVYCVHFNEKIIVTGSRDLTIKVWDAKSGALMQTLGGVNHEQHLENDEVEENIDIEYHENVIVENQPLFGSTTAFSTPSTAVTETTRSSSGNNDALDNSDQIRHKKSVLCLYFDNELMVSGSSDSSIILWKLPEFVAFKKIQEHNGGILDVTLDKRYICSCSKDSSICVWYRPKAASGSIRFDENTKVELKVRLKGHRSPVNSIHLRGDNIFSAGGDGLVKMWSIEKGVCLREFSGHKRGLACIQVSLDGKTLVSGSNDKQIRVWEIETGKCVRILEGHTALVRSLDICSGKIISGSYDQTLKIWDLETGALIHDMDKYFGSWIFSAKANCKRIVCTSFGIKPIILDFGTGLDQQCLDFISA